MTISTSVSVFWRGCYRFGLGWSSIGTSNAFATKIFLQKDEIILIGDVSIIIFINFHEQVLILLNCAFTVQKSQAIVEGIGKFLETHDSGWSVSIVALSVQALNGHFSKMLLHTEIRLNITRELRTIRRWWGCHGLHRSDRRFWQHIEPRFHSSLIFPIGLAWFLVPQIAHSNWNHTFWGHCTLFLALERQADDQWS